MSTDKHTTINIFYDNGMNNKKSLRADIENILHKKGGTEIYYDERIQDIHISNCGEDEGDTEFEDSQRYSYIKAKHYGYRGDFYEGDLEALVKEFYPIWKRVGGYAFIICEYYYPESDFQDSVTLGRLAYKKFLEVEKEYTTEGEGDDFYVCETEHTLQVLEEISSLNYEIYPYQKDDAITLEFQVKKSLTFKAGSKHLLYEIKLVKHEKINNKPLSKIIIEKLKEDLLSGEKTYGVETCEFNLSHEIDISCFPREEIQALEIGFYGLKLQIT